MSRGISRGDRIVVSTGNTHESVVAFWGTLKIGGIVSLVNGDISNDKLEYILKDSGASALVCTSIQYQSIYPLVRSCQLDLKCILLNSDNDFEMLPVVDLFDDALKLMPMDTIFSQFLDIDLASIIYTSGSTGEPKE